MMSCHICHTSSRYRRPSPSCQHSTFSAHCFPLGFLRTSFPPPAHLRLLLTTGNPAKFAPSCVFPSDDRNRTRHGIDGCHAISESFPNKDTLPTIAPYARSLSVMMCTVIQLFLLHFFRFFLHIQLLYSLTSRVVL
jgi:hypothetical protein